MTKLSPKTIEGLKAKLSAQKAHIEQELGSFASRDETLRGDWDTRFPKLDSNDNVDMEEEADEVEEYTTRLSIEQSLEKRLVDINLALEKIKKGTYGTCENCDEQIPLKRLKIYPEARLCLDCRNKT